MCDVRFTEYRMSKRQRLWQRNPGNSALNSGGGQPTSTSISEEAEQNLESSPRESPSTSGSSTSSCDSASRSLPQSTKDPPAPTNQDERVHTSPLDLNKPLKKRYHPAFICHGQESSVDPLPLEPIEKLKSLENCIDGTVQDSKEEASDEKRYEIEEIRDKRNYNGETWYLVKWKNYPDSENTWEPVEHFDDPSYIKTYDETHPESEEVFYIEKILAHRYVKKKRGKGNQLEILVKWVNYDHFSNQWIPVGNLVSKHDLDEYFENNIKKSIEAKNMKLSGSDQQGPSSKTKAEMEQKNARESKRKDFMSNPKRSTRKANNSEGGSSEHSRNAQGPSLVTTIQPKDTEVSPFANPRSEEIGNDNNSEDSPGNPIPDTIHGPSLVTTVQSNEEEVLPNTNHSKEKNCVENGLELSPSCKVANADHDPLFPNFNASGEKGVENAPYQSTSNAIQSLITTQQTSMLGGTANLPEVSEVFPNVNQRCKENITGNGRESYIEIVDVDQAIILISTTPEIVNSDQCLFVLSTTQSTNTPFLEGTTIQPEVSQVFADDNQSRVENIVEDGLMVSTIQSEDTEVLHNDKPSYLENGPTELSPVMITDHLEHGREIIYIFQFANLDDPVEIPLGVISGDLIGLVDEYNSRNSLLQNLNGVVNKTQVVT